MSSCHSTKGWDQPGTQQLVSALLHHLGLASCLGLARGTESLAPAPQPAESILLQRPWDCEPITKLPPGPARTSLSPWVCSFGEPTHSPWPSSPNSQEGNLPMGAGRGGGRQAKTAPEGRGDSNPEAPRTLPVPVVAKLWVPGGTI